MPIYSGLASVVNLPSSPGLPYPSTMGRAHNCANVRCQPLLSHIGRSTLEAGAYVLIYHECSAATYQPITRTERCRHFRGVQGWLPSVEKCCLSQRLRSL